MKLRRVQIGAQTVVQVQADQRWVALADVLSGLSPLPAEAELLR